MKAGTQYEGFIFYSILKILIWLTNYLFSVNMNTNLNTEQT